MELQLRIELVENEGGKYIGVLGYNEERFERHGFGTFMQDINPEEIECNQGALDFLLGCPERGGLNGLEFWPNKMLAWGAPDQMFLIPLDSVNVPTGAKVWIKDFKILKEPRP